jgi:hypothetical protein
MSSTVAITPPTKYAGRSPSTTTATPIQAGGGQGIQVNFAIVATGSGTEGLPSLSLDDIPDIRWRAEGIDDARPGVVESWVLNGGRAMGTVTFEVEGTGETVSGDFDILCAGL